MNDILKPFFKTKKDIDNFDSDVDQMYDFQVHYYNQILAFLDNNSEFVNAGIGFSKKEDRRVLIEFYHFSDLYSEKFSLEFQHFASKMIIAIGANRIRIDVARTNGDKYSAAIHYIYYFNSFVNISLALLSELQGKEIMSCDYKPFWNSKGEESAVSKLNTKGTTVSISTEDEVEEYLNGERDIDNLSPDAETWLYEILDDD